MSFEPLRRLSVADMLWLIVVLGVAVALAFGSLLAQTLQAIVPVEVAVARIERTGTLAHEVMNARLHITAYLASGDTDAYEAGERALLGVMTDIEAEQSADYVALRELEQHSVETLNAFRSFAGLMQAGAPADAQQAARSYLDETATALEQRAQTVFDASMSSIHDASHSISASLLSLGAILFIGLSAAFAISWILSASVAARTTHALSQMSVAVQQIAAGHYGTRMALTTAHNRELATLTLAFNDMAEALQSARQSEASANKQNHAQLLKLARQERLTAILEERQRLARELHDSVKQQLFSITLSAGAAANLIERAPDLVKTHLETIKRSGQYAQGEMTALLQELAPVPLQDNRLEDALLGYLTPLCETHGLKLLWRADGTNTLTIAQEHALFRAVQEAASNSIRHSDATVLRVSLNFGLMTHVIVEDDGRGFLSEAVPPTASGLSMMQGRLKRVGGRCELQSTPGVGTRLTILLDLRRIKDAL